MFGENKRINKMMNFFNKLTIFFLGVFFMFSCKGIANLQVSSPDIFSVHPEGTYKDRKQNYLQYAAKYAKNGDKSLQHIFPQIARAALGQRLNVDSIRKSLNIIYSNTDCNDFTMNGLLRLSYMNKEKAIFDECIKKEVEECILDFKYWWDDVRRDTTYRCYHTENHQALYHTAELLAGQLYKDRKFSSGMTGKEHIEHAIERLEPWLEYRFRFGFSEWLSTYYEVDIMILTNLYDFSENELIRKRAGLVLDLLFFDLALNNFHGVLPTSSGRIYSHSLITGIHAISPTLKLAFGQGQYLPNELMATTCLALSKYEVPSLLQEIALDYDTDLFNKQRVSLNVEDAPMHGLSYDNELNTHLFWGMQEFIHPDVVHMSKNISCKYNTYPYGEHDYNKYIVRYEDEKKKYGKVVDPHLDRFALSEANLEVYRTSDFILSTAKNYRKGAEAYQQHIWEAALDRYAVVFTNHPGSKDPMNGSPNYWAGSEYLPKSTQFKNVSISIYKIPEKSRLKFTHAYFPKVHFDEVVEKENWVFGRKGNGYVALYSMIPTHWGNKVEKHEVDLIAEGYENIWICEVGRAKEWKSFQHFVDAISSSNIIFNGLTVDYNSPSRGSLNFGWDLPLRVNNNIVSDKEDYRYNNIYSKTPFDSKIVKIMNRNKVMTLDYDNAIKSISKR